MKHQNTSSADLTKEIKIQFLFSGIGPHDGGNRTKFQIRESCLQLSLKRKQQILLLVVGGKP